MTAAGRTARRSQSQRALAARHHLRERFAGAQRIAAAFLTADDEAVSAEQRPTETIARLDADVASARAERHAPPTAPPGAPGPPSAGSGGT